MRKALFPGINCWTSWLACMLEVEHAEVKHCTTENDDWKKQTDDLLAQHGLFFVEVHPGAVSILPKGILLGAHVNGRNAPHIVIARVKHYGERHGFEVAHDPSGRFATGQLVAPHTIVILGRLDK